VSAGGLRVDSTGGKIDLIGVGIHHFFIYNIYVLRFENSKGILWAKKQMLTICKMHSAFIDKKMGLCYNPYRYQWAYLCHFCTYLKIFQGFYAESIGFFCLFLACSGEENL
jgi:hypothetical protein